MHQEILQHHGVTLNLTFDLASMTLSFKIISSVIRCGELSLDKDIA